jgi:hypothetical protein
MNHVYAAHGQAHEICTHAEGEPTLLEAVHDLHRQAHPTQPADVVLCKAEPCRSLRFDTLTGAA